MLEHSPGDLRVTAQAGVALAALQRRLAGDRQRLALDPPQDGATLGGIVASQRRRPAAPPLRQPARPAPRGDPGARRRHRRPGRWQGRQERRRVRPLQALSPAPTARSPWWWSPPSGCTTPRRRRAGCATRWTTGDSLRALLAGVRHAAGRAVRPGTRRRPRYRRRHARRAAGGGAGRGRPPRVARVRAALGGEDEPGPGAGPGDGGLLLHVAVAPAGVAGRAGRATGRAGSVAAGPADRPRRGRGAPDRGARSPAGRGARRCSRAVRRLAGRHDGTATVVHAPSGAQLDVWGPVRGAGRDAPGEGSSSTRVSSWRPAGSWEASDDRRPAGATRQRCWTCSATACTAASACRPARPTSCGGRRWTRRAGGST